ncbi:MAG: hypothetical protein ACJ72Q_19405 [Nitrososphaeraceae archaeon]
MERLSSVMEQQNQQQHQEQLQIQWRRDKIQELCSKEYSQREIMISAQAFCVSQILLLL